MRSNHLWLLTLAVTFLSAASAAQQTTTMAAGASAGNTTINVRVTYQQNHRPAPGLRVELVSPFGGVADMRTTDGNGGTTFSGVSGGRYQVRITGPGIETTESASFDAGGSQGGPYVTENIQVRLTEAAGNVSSSQALAPIVPEAAKQEFTLG